MDWPTEIDGRTDPHRETSQSQRTLLGKAPTCRDPSLFANKILQRWRGKIERANLAAPACLDIGIDLSTARGGARTQRPQGARVSTQLPYSSYGH